MTPPTDFDDEWIDDEGNLHSFHDSFGPISPLAASTAVAPYVPPERALADASDRWHATTANAIAKLAETAEPAVTFNPATPEQLVEIERAVAEHDATLERERVASEGNLIERLRDWVARRGSVADD